MSTPLLVGGGTPFTSASPLPGQAIALGLVPVGGTPIAFFPPTAGQSVQAFSVIFQEAPVGKRKKRSEQYNAIKDHNDRNSITLLSTFIT